MCTAAVRKVILLASVLNLARVVELVSTAVRKGKSFELEIKGKKDLNAIQAY